jgi:hypothetical protein
MARATLGEIRWIKPIVSFCWSTDCGLKRPGIDAYKITVIC